MFHRAEVLKRSWFTSAGGEQDWLSRYRVPYSGYRVHYSGSTVPYDRYRVPYIGYTKERIFDPRVPYSD